MDIEGVDGYSLSETTGSPFPAPSLRDGPDQAKTKAGASRDEYIRNFFAEGSSTGASEVEAFAKALPDTRSDLVSQVQDRVASGFYKQDKIQNLLSERLADLLA